MWTLQRSRARVGTPAVVRDRLGEVRWERARPDRRARAAKRRAARSYTSQLRAPRSPYRLLPTRIAAHELLQGGELLGAQIRTVA